MSSTINLKIIFGQIKAQYSLQYTQQESTANIKIESVFSAVNKFICNYDIYVRNHLGIWIITKNEKRSLLEMKKSCTSIKLASGQDNMFSLELFLQDIEDDKNLMKLFYHSSEQYKRLKNNIDKLVEQSKIQQQKRQQNSNNKIDIAYFFADPLVTVQKNKIITKHEVSYQLQYDKFIELVKKENFGKNVRIEMMTATISNIKTTLINGASILHFSCHGKKQKGNLQIESENSVGQLVDLQHRQFMNLLDIKNNLPQLIIFNVCYSSILAEMVSKSKRIITIAYKGEALDACCQQFTRQFYIGLFKYKYSIRQIFQSVKDRISKQNPIEGDKLCIFPIKPFPNQQKFSYFRSIQSRLDHMKRWTQLENMRENDCLGVKIEMFTFIKQYLTNDQRISYFFLKGEPCSGKSDFMKKTKIYVINRKVFTQGFTIDLRGKDFSLIDTMLKFRLQKQDSITKKMKKLKHLPKEEHAKPIIIIDHAQKILELQYAKFIEFVQNTIMKGLKYGKIVIVTNNVVPINAYQAETFKKEHFHMKSPPKIEERQIQNYIKRYARQSIRPFAQQMYKQKNYHSHLQFVKALKKSKSQKQMQQLCQKQQKFLLKQDQSISITELDNTILQIQKSLQYLQQFAAIKIQENHYFYLSSIFSEIHLEDQQNYTSQKCILHQLQNEIASITQKFYLLVKNIFKNINKEMDYCFIQSRLLNLLPLSLKIGGFIYIYNKFQIFQKHLLNCQKLHVLINGYMISEILIKSTFSMHLAQYKLKILLALYSFYSENEAKIKFKDPSDVKARQQQQHEQSFNQKSLIIAQLIEAYFKNNQYQTTLSALKSLWFVDKISQELHYNKTYCLYARDQQLKSRVQIYQSKDQYDLQQQSQLAARQNKKIIQYWSAFENIQKRFTNEVILNKRSIELISVLIIKKISFNLCQLETIFDQRQSFLNQNIHAYMNFYIKIIQKIEKDKIFQHIQKGGIFLHYQSQAVKPLYQLYLKTYFQTYFHLTKNIQKLTKAYEIPIYYKLIKLCEKQQQISGITSIKKMIQLHINKQFLNNWICPTFVSLPLLYKRNEKFKYNIKRFENHVYNFTSHLFQSQVNKQVKCQFKIFGEQFLSQQRKQNKYLVQLIICDCSQQDQKIYLQDICSESKAYPIKSLSLPKSPITIFFGKSVKILKQIYNQNKQIGIWINMDRKDRDMQYILQKQKDLALGQKYITVFFNIFTALSVAISLIAIIPFFYSRSKILMAWPKHKQPQKLSCSTLLINLIQTIINQIDSNLQELIAGNQLRKIPAYNFIEKQKKPTQNQLSQRLQRPWQLGCNHQIHHILSELFRIKIQTKQAINFIIRYKSQIMLRSFLDTLRIKLIKINKFNLHPIVNHKNYQEYCLNKHKNRNIELQQQKLPQIIPFVNLQQKQISQQLALSISQINIFCLDRGNYSINHKENLSISIQEHYKTNKAQFEFYYLSCKTQKPYLTQDQLLDKFKNVTSRNQSNLLDIESQICESQ